MRIPFESLHYIDESDTGYSELCSAEKDVKEVLSHLRESLDDKYIKAELVEINGKKFAKAIHDKMSIELPNNKI